MNRTALMALPLTLLLLQLLFNCGSCSPIAQHEFCRTQEGAEILSRMALNGGIEITKFPFRVAAAAAECAPPPDGALSARLILTVGGGGDPWSFRLATTDSASVLMSDPAGRIIYWSRRRGTFAVSRTSRFGLVQCQRLEAGADRWGDIARQLSLAGPQPQGQAETAAAAAAAAAAALHFGYSRAWQLRLSDAEALELTVLHEGARVCATRRGWRALDTGETVEYAVMLEEFQHGLATDEEREAFRLPTVCYRVDL